MFVVFVCSPLTSFLHQETIDALDESNAWKDRAAAIERVESQLSHELSSNDPTERSYGERIATNTPIQGSAADICKLAMLEIDERLAAAGHEARMLLQIHDELLFECPPEEVEAVEGLVRAVMERPLERAGLELDVPLVVDIGHGESWAAAK